MKFETSRTSIQKPRSTSELAMNVGSLCLSNRATEWVLPVMEEGQKKMLEAEMTTASEC